MKTPTLSLLVLAGAMAIGRAQTGDADKPRPVPVPQGADYRVTYQTNVPYARKLGELQVTYGGVAHELRRGGARRLLEPARPSSPAYPFQNVSVNPRTGRAEGILLFSVRF